MKPKVIFVFFLCLSVFMNLPVLAQEIDHYVSVDAPDGWVKGVDLTDEDMAYGKGQEVSYILVDEQYRITRSEREKYSRYVELLKTPQGVEDYATLTISFDPEFQSVKIHHLSIIRNGEKLDKLDLSGFQLYRYETDRYKLMYNGELELSYVIPDVRVGDILDYSYTVSGKNPAYGEHVFAAFRHQYAVPINIIHQRLSVPQGLELSSKSYHDVIAADERISEEYKVYSWLLKDLEGLILDDDTPYWYRDLPQTNFSSFENWSEVGKHFAPYYTFDTIDQRVKEIASDIARQTSDKKVRARKALDYVQREIRYLGIEIGSGGYIPRPPAKTLDQRFGDCKDMTVLLVSILTELGIEAYPLLVDTYDLGMVEHSIPSYAAFDHVIVYAKIGEQGYFLDPTMGEQIGDTLDITQQGDYEKGLIISNDSEGLISVTPPRPAFYKDIVDTFIVDDTKEDSAVQLEGSFTYYQGEADYMLGWYKSKPHEEIEKSFREYYQDSFPTIESGILVIQEFPEEGKVTFTAKYTIPNAWKRDDERKRLDFYASPKDLRTDLPSFVGAKRIAPYELAYPIRTRHTLKFFLDDHWEFDDEEYTFSSPSFDFQKITKFESAIYTETYSYVTKEDHIKPEDFARTMSGVKEVRGEVGIELYDSTHYPKSSVKEEGGDESDAEALFNKILEKLMQNAELILGVWIGGAILISAIFWIFIPSNDKEYRDQLIFYPVAMRKFVPMVFLTLGVYQFHWCYKNWQWLRDVRHEKVSPSLRAFFAIITNFILFSRFAKMEEKGFAWFKYAAMPLAILVVIGTLLSDVSEKVEGIPFWVDMVFLLLTLVTFTIVAMQVNKMNEGKEEYINKNSRFGWPAIGMILLFLPFTAFMVWATIVL